MTNYFLKAERMTVVTRADDGRVTDRRRYRRGDKIEGLPKDRLKALVESGSLVTKEDDAEAEDASATATSPTVTSGSPEDGTAPHGEGSMQPVGGGYDVEAASTATADESQPADRYADMPYADLQQEAKSRDLNAGGSADDLRARLREADAK